MQFFDEEKIRERLSHVEEDFLQAATLGGFALMGFDERWSTLLSDLEYAIRNETINDATKSLANVIALRVSILTDCLLDYQTNADVMQNELESVFARVGIHDVTNEVHETSTPQITPSTFSQSAFDVTACPPYVESAYRWLMKNLHNPYPSTEVKDAISMESGSYRKVIDAWFIDVRKRIGWNALRRKHFSNKRIKIVDAATRFFLCGDSAQSQDYRIKFDSEFISLETRAKNLYSEKFSESALVSKLDMAVKDMTPEMKTQANVIKKQRGQREGEASYHAEKDAQAASSYPSPRRSPSLSPEPLLSSEEIDLSIVSPMSDTGRKRSMSSRGSPECGSERSTSRPNKRSRLDTASDVDDPAINLPSPAPSPDEPFPASDDGALVHSPAPCTPAVLVANRKRRLSETDSQSAPKRPRNVLSGSRLHTVSNPLPSPSTLAAWLELENHFGIPSVMTAEEPNSSIPFDVELYDYSKVTMQMHLSGALGSPIQSCDDSTVAPLSSFETSVPESRISPCSLTVTTNDFNYNELFGDEITTGGFARDPSTNELSFPIFNPYLFEYNFAQNPLNVVATIPDTAIIADSSISIPQNPDTPFDWMFPPMLTHQNTFPSLEGMGLDTLSHHEGLKFNASFQPKDLFNDIVMPSVTEAGKAAKQRKLLEMKEATRRLEAEIAAS